MDNILIVNLSKINNTSKNSESYSSDLGEIEGCYTNDAPVKYIITLLNSNNERLDKIICLVTEEAENAFDGYSDTVNSFCEKNNCDKPEIIKVNIKFAQSGFINVIENTLKNINQGDNIYLDTTGGARNSSYLLMLIVRYLEFDGSRLKKAIYSNYQNKCIEDITELYSLFNIITATNSFTSFGNASQLNEIFENTTNESIKEIISSMNAFSDSITLCKTDIFDQLKRLEENLSDFKKSESDEEKEMLFQGLINVIRKKFTVDGENSITDCIGLIRWCLNNNLVQQAITIYTEKIPEYLYENKYFTANEETENNTVYSFHYELFYNGFLAINTNGKYTDKYSIFFNEARYKNQMAICSSYNEFIRKNKGVTDPDIRKIIEAIINAKNLLYFAGSRRDVNVSSLKIKNPQIPDFLFDFKAKNPEKFINEICSNVDRLVEGVGVKRNIYETDKLNTVAHFREVINKTEDYSIPDAIGIDKMERICNDYLFIKLCFRNAINHASNEGICNEETKTYFTERGYLIKEVFTVQEIKDILGKVLDNIK